MNDDHFQQIAAAARASFVSTVECHERLGSTSVRALELCQEADLATPAVVIARRQTEGRGRGTNTWWSAEGSLTFSLIFALAEEGLQAGDLPRVGLATAVALSDACAMACPNEQTDVAIKWPNDVLIAGRKVAGILVEAPRKTESGLERVVVGIGINVNNPFVAAPPEVRRRGTSLSEVLGVDIAPGEFMASILNNLRPRLRQLACGDPSLPESWSARCGLRGYQVRVVVGHTNVCGACLGIAADGALMIRDETLGGPTRKIYSGHVADVSPLGEEGR